MILIEAGERSDRSFDAKLLFATQLAARGHRIMLDDRTLPDRLERYQKYEAAPHLADLDEVEVARIILIGAESIGQDTLTALRHRQFDAAVPVHVVGRFADRQGAIAARAKVAYALGREPELVDLAALQGTALVANAISPLAAAPVPSLGQEPAGPPSLFVVLKQEALEDPMVLPLLSAMDQVPEFRLRVILPGKGKEQVKATRHAHLTVFGLSELSPATLAARADIAAFFGDGVPGERMAAFALDVMRSGRVAIDCTSGAGFVTAGAPAIRGAEDLGALANHVRHTVLVNRRQIGLQARKSPWLVSRSVEPLEAALGLPAPVTPEPAADGPVRNRVVFLPTNGVGIGHARRCALIAAEIDRGEAVPAFAAFPSCVPLLRAEGYDCLPLVAKSPDHPEDHANDLITYLRLRQALNAGDRLVFDGGFVFDSVFRTIFEKGLEAVWVRRGLWQAGQMHGVTLDRERAFARVIVPGEAFPELNADRGGARVHAVGPVVQRRAVPDAAARGPGRARLAARIGGPFGELVVTMLGGGVAADRTAQVQAVAAIVEGRKTCFNLVVVWPGAVVPAGLAGWKNTRVVQTRDALWLCLLADLVISAAGYNSFHELLYHGIPTIFVPQMAAYMDDQERRARAASERGFAETVLAHEMLLLEREITAFLDQGKAERLRKALVETVLPEPGNRAAAALILGQEAP